MPQTHTTTQSQPATDVPMDKDAMCEAVDAMLAAQKTDTTSVGWHSSDLGYAHITFRGDEFVDLQFHGEGENPDDAEQAACYLHSVRRTIAFVGVVHAALQVVTAHQNDTGEPLTSDLGSAIDALAEAAHLLEGS